MALVAPNGTVDALVGEDALVVGLAGLVGLRIDVPMIGGVESTDVECPLETVLLLTLDVAPADDALVKELNREENSPDPRFVARGGNGQVLDSSPLGVTDFSDGVGSSVFVRFSS